MSHRVLPALIFSVRRRDSVDLECSLRVGVARFNRQNIRAAIFVLTVIDIVKPRNMFRHGRWRHAGGDVIERVSHRLERINYHLVHVIRN